MQIYQNLKREKEEYQLLPEALERELLTDKNN
jgi:hypothetical protein